MGHIKKKSRCRWNGCSASLGTKTSLLHHMSQRHWIPVADDLLETAEYCFECAEYFFRAVDWEDHCNSHLSNLDLFCGFITRRNIFLYARRCPFCLGNRQLTAAMRCRDFTDSKPLFDHLDGHLNDPSLAWPLLCPHPQCGEAISSAEGCLEHFHTVHHLARYHRSNATSSDGAYSNEDEGLASDDGGFEYGEASIDGDAWELSLIDEEPALICDRRKEASPSAVLVRTGSEQLPGLDPQNTEIDLTVEGTECVDPELLRWDEESMDTTPASVFRPTAPIMSPAPLPGPLSSPSGASNHLTTATCLVQGRLESLASTEYPQAPRTAPTKVLAKEEIVDEPQCQSYGKNGRPKQGVSCGICGQPFRTSRDMASHMIKEHDRSPYTCQLPAITDSDKICGRKFRDNTRLRDHLVSHSSNARLRCKHEGCPHSFLAPANLTRHVLEAHRSDVYQCTTKRKQRQCRFKTNIRAKFDKHMRKCHRGSSD